MEKFFDSLKGCPFFKKIAALLVFFVLISCVVLAEEQSDKEMFYSLLSDYAQAEAYGREETVSVPEMFDLFQTVWDEAFKQAEFAVSDEFAVAFIPERYPMQYETVDGMRYSLIREDDCFVFNRQSGRLTHIYPYRSTDLASLEFLSSLVQDEEVMDEVLPDYGWQLLFDDSKLHYNGLAPELLFTYVKEVYSMESVDAKTFCDIIDFAPDATH